MKVLLTGASSPLGRSVRAHLAATNDVISLIGPGRGEADHSEFSVDITDTARVSRIAQEAQPEAVIHLAAVAAGGCDRDPERARSVNVEALRELAEMSAALGVQRFVFASSAAVYGDRRCAPVSETDAVEPVGLYGELKLEGEGVLTELEALPSTSLRIFNVYGSGLDRSLVNRLIDRPDGTRLALRGPDDFVRDYVHVDDVASAFSAAVALGPSPDAPIINIGSGVASSNRRLMDILSLRCPEDVEFVGGPPSYSWADIGRARSLLGFAPRDLRRQENEEA